jgi:hypothetical protein
LIINLFKIPFHVLVWGTITWSSLLIDVVSIPGIAAGAFIGFRIVKWIPEKAFRYLVIAMTLFAAVRLLF